MLPFSSFGPLHFFPFLLLLLLGVFCWFCCCCCCFLVLFCFAPKKKKKKDPSLSKYLHCMALGIIYSLWLWNGKWAVSWFCFNTSSFPPFPWPRSGNAAATICSLTQQDEKVCSGVGSPCHQLWVPLHVSELEQFISAHRPPVSSKS